MTTVEKIINVLDPVAGKLQETVIEEKETKIDAAALFESKGGRRMTLAEASTTAEFPVILRDGIRSIVFDSYAGLQTTWQQFVMQMPSDKPQEDWVEENQFGELPLVAEGNPYPETKMDIDRTVSIKNYKRGMILAVTEEIIKFNRLNILKRYAEKMGQSAARTRDQACFSVLTDTNNYVRNSTTNDNDVGANYGSTQFSATGILTAIRTLRTMKDRKSGVYLGIEPDTLVVTPGLEFAAKQLLLAPSLLRVGTAGTADAYGTGTDNPFRGVVRQIIVSPRMGSTYQWALMQAKQAIVLQEVEGLSVVQEAPGMVNSEAWLRYDAIRYKVRDWFGVGMLNDRYAYLSTSTSAPISA